MHSRRFGISSSKSLAIICWLLFWVFCPNSFAVLKLKNEIIGVPERPLANCHKMLGVNIDRIKQLTVLDIYHLFAEGDDDILDALKPYGYFKASISQKSLTHIGNNWTATYHVVLGPVMKITAIDFNISGEGATTKIFEELIKKLPLQVGDDLDTEKYNLFKQKLLDLAMYNGYVAAKFIRSEIHISLKNYRANIILYFDTGPQHFFGPIHFFNYSKLDPKFLAKFASFKPGDKYNANEVYNTQENFNNSGLFRSVSVEPDIQNPRDLQVPIDVHIMPRHSQQYDVGIGYGTDTGLRGLLNFNLYNLTSTGQYLETSLKLATITESELELHYVIPGSNPVTDRYDISAVTQRFNTPFGNTTVQKIGPGYTTTIFNWQQNVRLDFQHEEGTFLQHSINSTIIVPAISWSLKKANDLIRPTKGYSINILMRGTIKDFGSDFNFLQTRVDAKWMQPIFKGPIFVLRGTLGYDALKEKYYNDLPMSFWFATGGSQTIRGYPYQSIGPGTRLFDGGAELRQRIFDDAYASVFWDCGNANNHLFTRDEPFDKYQGAGIGFTWLSPIGAVRISLAKEIVSHYPHDGHLRLQFSIGPEL